MFEIKNVTKKYGDEYALRGVSMEIVRGMNFILGASGSGKTTLLKIISGMDSGFSGEALYCGKEISGITADEKSFFYNNVFGFVWQDFNLLSDCTVIENVLISGYLKEGDGKKAAEKILKELKILNLAKQKVKYLSGGQKQRVAIARELMKNPQVIIADEPTSALDEKTSKLTMDILRGIAKTKTVIVVTHDRSLITKQDSVFELDSGELVAKPAAQRGKAQELPIKPARPLSIKSAFCLAKQNIKNNIGRTLAAVVTLLLAGVLLMTTFGGAVTKSGENEISGLLSTYGEALYDIGLYSSFTSAAGTDGKDEKKPDGAVNQNLSGLYEKYAKDVRVNFIAYMQAFSKIKVAIDGKETQIQSSGSAPTINKLVAGKMPMGGQNEVAVPESFVKTLGLSPEKALGKEIDFKGAVVDWSTGSPIYKDTGAKAKIVGVMDTTAKYEYAGQLTEYTVDDSFLFSKAALDEMYKKVGMNGEGKSFSMRANSAADMISLKNELNADGIVPIGRFELVEDVVNLGGSSKEQTGAASGIIAVLALVVVGAVFLITGAIRKREYAIYKVCGYRNRDLCLVSLAECALLAAIAALLFCAASPLLDRATTALFAARIDSVRMYALGVSMVVFSAAVAFFAAASCALRANPDAALKAGDR